EGVLVDCEAAKNLDQVLEQLATDAGTEDSLIESITDPAPESDETSVEEEELDLSAGESDKAADPVRLYMREMGRVALLTKAQEGAIGRRIGWGRPLRLKSITRSPISLARLFRIAW